MRRRLAQDALVAELKTADVSAADAVSMLQGWVEADWSDDKAVLAFFESKGTLLEEKMGEVKVASVKSTIESLLADMSDADKDALLKSL